MKRLAVSFLLISTVAFGAAVERYGMFEANHAATTQPANPYKAISATATVIRPDGTLWRVPLFWDGATSWKLRVSPDITGKWSYTVEANDAGLAKAKGAFEVIASSRKGAIQALPSATAHFARQKGEPFWFLGDTAWGYFTDSPEDKHYRAQAEYYVKARVSQGFNVIHCMMMSEQGVGNDKGLPFTAIEKEEINPAYWQEVDRRLAFANAQGLTVGMAVAWGDKGRKEVFPWRRFPDVEARKRYARYAAARYAAYDVYFIVSGEWHGELRTREGAIPEAIYREFVEIGEALDEAEPHGRMIAIHPMSSHGSVREFKQAKWMSFGDYQQNYRQLHGRALVSRFLGGPVVNSEYGYHLRDANGDGIPDKANSYSAEDMRFATWDIVMAGAYVVTGFGTTYFAGHRDPGPFGVDAAKNDEWELQAGLVRKFFESFEYARVTPADDLLTSKLDRGRDRDTSGPSGEAARSGLRPPASTYWALADTGRTYVVYMRGMNQPVELIPGARHGRYRLRWFNPRSGGFTQPLTADVKESYTLASPDAQDWVALLEVVR
jgi:hypothetical protein